MKNAKIRKMSISRMFHLLAQSREADKPIQLVVLTYDYPMKDYHKAKIDFARYWSKVSDAFPGCGYFCSFDKKWDGGWYIHLFLLSPDSFDDIVPFKKLYSFWKLGDRNGTSISSEEFFEYLQMLWTPKEEEDEEDEEEDEDEEDLS